MVEETRIDMLKRHLNAIRAAQNRALNVIVGPDGKKAQSKEYWASVKELKDLMAKERGVMGELETHLHRFTFEGRVYIDEHGEIQRETKQSKAEQP